MFRNPFPNAFGLDIGDLSIKLVLLRNMSHRRHAPRYELIDARSISLPPGLIVNGELQQPEQVRHYIKKLLQGKNNHKRTIKSPWVVASLPETQGFIKLLSIPKNLEDIIEDDIVIEARKHIPFTDEDKYYMDWEIIAPNPADSTTRVLITAIPKLIADSYVYLLESLGLGVVALEIEALSITRAMVTAKKEYTGEARALLDIGATRSSLIVYDDDAVQFSTSIPFSGELVTTALEQSLHISHDEAETMKQDVGLGYKKQHRAWASSIKLVKNFAEHIQKDIIFYYSHFNNTNRITHITMCGGGSNLKHLDTLLTKELNIECSPGHVWKNLSSKKSIHIDDDMSRSLATAIGLALRAADNPFFRFDSI